MPLPFFDLRRITKKAALARRRSSSCPLKHHRISLYLHDLHLHHLFTFRIGDVHGTGDTRIEAVNGTQDLQRLLCIVQGVTGQGGFVGAGLT
jgi:hypothetical protein